MAKKKDLDFGTGLGNLDTRTYGNGIGSSTISDFGIGFGSLLKTIWLGLGFGALNGKRIGIWTLTIILLMGLVAGVDAGKDKKKKADNMADPTGQMTLQDWLDLTDDVLLSSCEAAGLMQEGSHEEMAQRLYDHFQRIATTRRR